MEYNHDEIKRKLRQLKKLEVKVKTTEQGCCNRKYHLNENEHKQLIWNKFFDLKDSSTKKVKYTLEILSGMSKDEFKEAINEYLFYVYSYYSGENNLNVHFIDEEILTHLGLPMYADATEIKRKFRELAKEYHPDNGGDNKKFIELIEMYKNFKD